MTQYATWASYGGEARTWLALGLLAAAGAAVLAGIRLPMPVRFNQPGPAGRAAIMLAWGTSVTALLVCATIYFQQAIHDIRASGLSAPAPRLTILPVTLTAAAVLFVTIISRRSPDLPTRLASAAIGAIAAPMIFELPFDPVVIFRIHTVVHAPRPWALVYPPLLLVEITTLLLLRLSPMVRLTRATFFSFALMLGVWAAWALVGFGYPSAPLPIALNIASKILAFVAAFTLFLPEQPTPECRTALPGGHDAVCAASAGTGRGTVSHTALAAASTWPSGPSSADPAVSLRPSRPSGQAMTRHWSPAVGGVARLAVIWPSRIAVSRGRPAASPTAIPLGQSSAAQTISGRTLPSASATERSGVHGAAHSGWPVTGPGKIRSPSPGRRPGPQTKQSGKSGSV
jgi:hypothetical protein